MCGRPLCGLLLHFVLSRVLTFSQFQRKLTQPAFCCCSVKSPKAPTSFLCLTPHRMVSDRSPVGWTWDSSMRYIHTVGGGGGLGHCLHDCVWMSRKCFDTTCLDEWDLIVDAYKSFMCRKSPAVTVQPKHSAVNHSSHQRSWPGTGSVLVERIWRQQPGGSRVRRAVSGCCRKGLCVPVVKVIVGLSNVTIQHFVSCHTRLKLHML